MHKWTALALGLLTMGAIALVARAPAKTPEAADAPALVKETAQPGATVADPAAVLVDAGAPTPEEAAVEALEEVDAGATLLSGELAPAIGSDAPKSVIFGVILVQYKGAQGALPDARSREDALELARRLATEAQQDFKAAVAKGDKGSTENLGRLPRGVLEPAPEYVLFSLAKGAVSEPVDTPRGFWIARRIE